MIIYFKQTHKIINPVFPPKKIIKTDKKEASVEAYQIYQVKKKYTEIDNWWNALEKSFKTFLKMF